LRAFSGNVPIIMSSDETEVEAFLQNDVLLGSSMWNPLTE